MLIRKILKSAYKLYANLKTCIFKYFLRCFEPIKLTQFVYCKFSQFDYQNIAEHKDLALNRNFERIFCPCTVLTWMATSPVVSVPLFL